MAFQSRCILYILNRVSHRLSNGGMGGLVSRFVTPDQIRSVFRPIEKRLIDRALCNWYFATWGIVFVVVVIECVYIVVGVVVHYLSRSHNYWWFAPVETVVGRCIYVFISIREWATSPWGTTVYIYNCRNKSVLAPQQRMISCPTIFFLFPSFPSST